MLVVLLLLLVVVVLAAVLAVRAARLATALRTATADLATARAEAATTGERAEAAAADAAAVRAELALAHDATSTAGGERDRARSEVEEAVAATRTAEAAAREAATLARGAQAEAEAARRQVRAAADAAAGHPGWVDVLARLEGVRGERTWRTVAPMDDLPGADRSGDDGLTRGLEVELQWLRDVVGTPGRLATLDEHQPHVPTGPADLVTLLVAQEVLDVVGRRVEALDVAYARTTGDVRLTVSSPEAEHPVDAEGRLARLIATVAPLAAELTVEADVDGPGVVVRLVVPVAAAD